jgi:hypothetical protein
MWMKLTDEMHRHPCSDRRSRKMSSTTWSIDVGSVGGVQEPVVIQRMRWMIVV